MPESELCHLLIRAAPDAALRTAARERAIHRLASLTGVACGADEIQAAADQFRLERGLVSFEATQRWLTERGLTAASWQELLRTDVLERKLLAAERIGEAARVRFDRSPEEFAKANVGILSVEDEGIAWEIRLLLTEERRSFEVLARRYSVDFAHADRPHPASRRMVWRFEVPAPVADVAFASGFRGPYDAEPVQVGALWRLYRVYGVDTPSYDADTERRLRSICLDEALRAHRVRAFGELLDELGCPRVPDLETVALAGGDDTAGHTMRDGLAKRAIDVVNMERLGRPD